MCIEGYSFFRKKRYTFYVKRGRTKLCRVNSLIKVSTNNKEIQILEFWCSNFIYLEYFFQTAQAINTQTCNKDIMPKPGLNTSDMFVTSSTQIFASKLQFSCEIAHCGKISIFVFQEIFFSTKKNFISKRRLSLDNNFPDIS